MTTYYQDEHVTLYHGDAPDPAGPAETHTGNIRAEAWAEGHRAGFADGVHPDDHITPNPHRKDRA